jgi:hypothetical protein
MDENLVLIIVGAILGGALSTIGFYFKLRLEVRAKVNEALFQLLDVWSLIGMSKFVQSDDFFKKFINQIKTTFPKENIGVTEEASIREGMTVALPLLIGSKNSEQSHYIDKYTNAVNNLASIYPVLAFRLSKNQMLIKFLSRFDDLTKEMETTDFDDMVINQVKSLTYDDAFIELEKDLKGLSKKSGIINQLSASKFIDRAKRKLEKIPDDMFNDYVSCVMGPAIQAHYDKLGIQNPNLVE